MQQLVKNISDRLSATQQKPCRLDSQDTGCGTVFHKERDQYLSRPCYPVNFPNVVPITDDWSLDVIKTMSRNRPHGYIIDDHRQYEGFCISPRHEKYLETAAGSSKDLIFQVSLVDDGTKKRFISTHIFVHKDVPEKFLNRQIEFYRESIIQNHIADYLEKHYPDDAIVPRCRFIRSYRSSINNNFILRLIVDDVKPGGFESFAYYLDNYVKPSKSTSWNLPDFNQTTIGDGNQCWIDYEDQAEMTSEYFAAILTQLMFNKRKFPALSGFENVIEKHFNFLYPIEWFKDKMDLLYEQRVRKILGKNFFVTLHKIHRSGYCHHDLHADNIFFNPDTFEFRFIDFGLADTFENTLKTRQKYSGKHPYMKALLKKKNKDIWETALKTGVFDYTSLKFLMLIELTASRVLGEFDLDIMDSRLLKDHNFFSSDFTYNSDMFTFFHGRNYRDINGIDLYETFTIPFKEVIAEKYAEEVLAWYFKNQK
jgi:hypothetical protein